MSPLIYGLGRLINILNGWLGKSILVPSTSLVVTFNIASEKEIPRICKQDTTIELDCPFPNPDISMSPGFVFQPYI